MKKLFRTVTVLMLTVSLSSCTVLDNITGSFTAADEDAETEQETETVNEITIGITDFDVYNPLTTGSDTVSDACGFIYEPLFGIDSNMHVYGVLAESYTTESDGNGITIQLRHGVYWHNGDDFTAADVVYTTNFIKYGGTRYDSAVEPIAAIVAVDDYTVYAKFNRAVPNAAAIFTYPIIKNGSMSSSYNPIGTGPFYIAYDGNLTAYDWHYGGRASIDRVNIRQVPDTDKLLTMFDASVIEYTTSAMLDMSNYMPKGNSRVVDYISNDMVFAGFNTQSAVFSDAAARRAVSLLIDRDNIVSNVYYSRAAATDYAINPASYAVFDTSKRHGTDNEAATSLLREGGWITDDNGTYVKSGKYFSIRILVNSSSAERVKIAEKLAALMNDLGMKAVVDAYDDDVFSSRLTARNYDMFIGETELLPNGDVTSLSATGENCFGYSNADIDTLLAQLGTVSGEEDIKSVSEALYRKLYEDAPFTPICFIKRGIAVTSRLKSGVEPSVGGYVRATENWSVK